MKDKVLRKFDWYHFSVTLIIAVLAFLVYSLSTKIYDNERQIAALNTLLTGRTSLFQSIIKQQTLHTKQLDALVVLSVKKCDTK